MSKKPREVTPENKELARFLAEVVGGPPKVHFYDHDFVDLSMPVFSVNGSPHPKLTSYSTIGLSDYPMMFEGKEYRTRVELAGICLSRYAEYFPNVLAALAFAIIRASLFVCPHRWMRDFVSLYYPDTTVPHIYFMSPYFLWDDKLTTTKFGDKTVTWLLAVPISEPERQFLEEKGEQEFENMLWAKEDVDVYNLWRDPSVPATLAKPVEPPTGEAK